MFVFKMIDDFGKTAVAFLLQYMSLSTLRLLLNLCIGIPLGVVISSLLFARQMLLIQKYMDVKGIEGFKYEGFLPFYKEYRKVYSETKQMMFR